MKNTIIGETKSGIRHKVDIISTSVPYSYVMKDIIIDPVYCLQKCKYYLQPKTGSMTKCPSRGKYHSCLGGPKDFRQIHPKIHTMDPVLFGVKLWMDREYDSRFMRQFFDEQSGWDFGNQSRLAKIKYAYGKLDLENNAMWKLIKKIVDEDKAVVYGFGHCKMCKKCSREWRKPCIRGTPIYSMERVGIIVKCLIKRVLGFDLQWIVPSDSGRDVAVRPEYMCSFALAFLEKKNIHSATYILDLLTELLSSKLNI